MASIRRTLSPIPQARTVSNVEVCSVASPLSKSSSNTQNCPPSTGLFFSSVSLLDSRAFVLGVFSPGSLRVLERSKSKVQLWRKLGDIIVLICRRFGTWYVAKLSGDKSGIVLQGPSCNGNRIIGWHINEPNDISKRFHAEMSGFAFNSTILWDPKRWHQPTLEPIRQLDSVKEGFWISTLIEQVVEDESQMEGLMNNCSKVMVWHIDLESSYSFYPQNWIIKNNPDAILHLPLV